MVLKNNNHNLRIMVVFSFISLLIISPIQAQHTLIILGPTEAYEGETVTFTILLDNQPVQARIHFGNLTTVHYSNPATGNVSFLMPSISSRTCLITLTANLAGEVSANHTILVKNKTKNIAIEISSDHLIETDPFTVKISENNTPLSQAAVIFNSQKFTTDLAGLVTLTAPDVLVTTAYTITVNKTGYQTNTTTIIINEAHRGIQLMDVIVPSIVEPREKNIPIHVINDSQSLPNVTLEILYEGRSLGTYQTDENGAAFFDAPMIDHDSYFVLNVQKEGYQTFTNQHEFFITLFTREFTSDLQLTLNPSEVYEGDMVTARVTDERGVRVKGVSIWRENKTQGNLTDANGILFLTTPFVPLERSYYYYAIKQGYNYAEETVTIRKRNTMQEQLVVHLVSSIDQQQIFSITVTDMNNNPISNVTIDFDNTTFITNEQGRVFCTAPSVATDTYWSIDAYKYGYFPVTASIQVLAILTSTNESTRQLIICTVPSIQEKNQFAIIVRDTQGIPIAHAHVTFSDTSLTTDNDGSVTCSAPDTFWDTTLIISATKNGYSTASAEILIKNSDGYSLWLLILTSCSVIIICILLWILRRRHSI